MWTVMTKAKVTAYKPYQTLTHRCKLYERCTHLIIISLRV